MTEFAVIGANGYLGRLISARLEAEGASLLRVTSRQTDIDRPDRLIWTYTTPPPAALSDARIWINCAFRLGAGSGNLALVRHLVEAREDQRFLQVSTNATLAYPGGAGSGPAVQRRGGEDYARIKRAIDRYLSRVVPAQSLRIVYPTAIIGDNSNWDQALAAMAGHSRVQLPGAGALGADWVTSHDAVTQILEVARDPDGPISRVLRSQPEKTWADLLSAAATGEPPAIAPLPSTRPFFDSAIKDLVFSGLCHPALPDRLALWLFAALRKRVAGTRDQAEDTSGSGPFTVTGPTRFYMAQDAGRTMTAEG